MIPTCDQQIADLKDQVRALNAKIDAAVAALGG